MDTELGTPVVVDLIGDLDTSLVAELAETLSAALARGSSVVVSTRHLSAASNEALGELRAAIGGARERGASILLDAGSRKMRSAFATAQLDHDANVPRPASARHYMIARHARTERLSRTA